MHQALHEQDCISDVFIGANGEHVLLTALIDVTEHADPPTVMSGRTSTVTGSPPPPHSTG